MNPTARYLVSSLYEIPARPVPSPLAPRASSHPIFLLPGSAQPPSRLHTPLPPPVLPVTQSDREPHDPVPTCALRILVHSNVRLIDHQSQHPTRHPSPPPESALALFPWSPPHSVGLTTSRRHLPDLLTASLVQFLFPWSRRPSFPASRSLVSLKPYHTPTDLSRFAIKEHAVASTELDNATPATAYRRSREIRPLPLLVSPRWLHTALQVDSPVRLLRPSPRVSLRAINFAPAGHSSL